MVIVDNFLRVSNSQALTGGGVGGFFASNAVLATTSGVAGRFIDLARGNEMALHVQVTEAFGGGDAAQLDTSVVAGDADDAGFFLTNLVNLTKWSNITALLTLNAEFTIPLAAIPRHMLDLVTGSTGRAYLGVLYQTLKADLTAGTYTTGKVTAYFGHWRDTTRPTIYKSGYTGP